MKETKILFLLKRREDYSAEKHSQIGMSTGLFNSASFMNDMLLNLGFNSEISVVIDNNCIDREVTKHKPTHVIIEALWVTPSKFYVLTKLHPNVKWIIRLHSETPFISNEGMAFDWLGDYVNFENVIIATNGIRILNELKDFIRTKNNLCEKCLENKIIYLPNFYPQNYKIKIFDYNKKYIDVSCFGAIRPLKNHVSQALAAIKFAEKIGKKLRFHINTGRVEQKGDSVLNNLKGIFGHLTEDGHQLVNHTWTPRENFIQICSKMDIGMQVSFSETFNIVAADTVTQGVPIVASNELPWISKLFVSKPTETESMYKKLLLTYKFPMLNNVINQYLLFRYTNKTKKIWSNYFKNEKQKI
jgi:hypothetical protein